jgi:predicted TIM-barrel fold metal-dependent hydrolase
MRLDRICRAFPEMPIVGAHVGAESWYEEATSMLEWLKNIYFDMSIAQFHYVRKNAPAGQEPRAIKSRIQELYDSGQLNLNRILFGSDSCVGVPAPSPSWPLSTLRFEMDGLGATDEEKESVRWTAAARILGIS